MRKMMRVFMVMCCFLTITGFTIAEVREYFQVVQKRVNKSIREEIPMDVEVDRLELLLTKTDRQVNRQKYQVAKAKVMLEESDDVLMTLQNDRDSILSSMRQLRDLQKQGTCEVKVGCHSISADDISKALAYKLKAYQLKTSAWEARKKSMEQQKQACQKLFGEYNEWCQKRKLLSHRLESLRSRLEANKAGDMVRNDAPQQSDLVRATELADEIERKLNIVETQQALGTTPIEGMLQVDSENVLDVTSEVDQLLETAPSISTK